MGNPADDDARPGTIKVTPCERGAIVTITRDGKQLGSIALPTAALEAHLFDAAYALVATDEYNAEMGNGMGITTTASRKLH